MFSNFACFVLLACAFQLSAADDFDFKECMKDYKKAAATYDAELKKYLEFGDAVRDKFAAEIEKKKWFMSSNPSCISKEYTKTTSREYVYTLAYLCMVKPMCEDDTYDAPWVNNPDLPAEDVCAFVATKGKTARIVIKNNNELIPKCDLMGLFDEIFQKSWDQCNEA